jgi:hypothetical protein
MDIKVNKYRTTAKVVGTLYILGFVVGGIGVRYARSACYGFCQEHDDCNGRVALGVSRCR